MATYYLTCDAATDVVYWSSSILTDYKLGIFRANGEIRWGDATIPPPSGSSILAIDSTTDELDWHIVS